YRVEQVVHHLTAAVTIHASPGNDPQTIAAFGGFVAISLLEPAEHDKPRRWPTTASPAVAAGDTVNSDTLLAAAVTWSASFGPATGSLEHTAAIDADVLQRDLSTIVYLPRKPR